MSAKKEQTVLAASAPFNSDYVDLQVFTSFSTQVNVINGTVDFAADVTLQVSNDFVEWIDVTGTTKPLAGVADAQIYDVVQSAVAYTRVKLDITAGTADIDIDWMLKP